MKKQDQYMRNIGLKFQIYNSIFLTIPLLEAKEASHLLPIFKEHCSQKIAEGKNPVEIVENFLREYKQSDSTEDRIAFLSTIVKLVERQIVLIDSLEDATFSEINDTTGEGSLYYSNKEIQKDPTLKEKLPEILQDFSLSIVLTAHPTQFYPSTILALIADLTEAIQDNNLQSISDYLHQLARTPFFQRSQPSPFREATNLVWYLENIFYDSVGSVINQVKKIVPALETQRPLLSLGFWPGGDRDGNPNVTTEVTEKVADRLHHCLLRCYYQHSRLLRRRISFRDSYEKIVAIESYLLRCLENKETWNLLHFQASLFALKKELIDKHNGLFVEKLEGLIDQTRLFGSHFAKLDIRQASQEIRFAFDFLWRLKHGSDADSDLPTDCQVRDVFEKCMQNEVAYDEWNLTEKEIEKMEKIAATEKPSAKNSAKHSVMIDTLRCFYAVQRIQCKGGEVATNRFIISLCHEDLDIFRLLLLARWTAYPKDSPPPSSPTSTSTSISTSTPIPIDVIPLFETIEDLDRAESIMTSLYKNPQYRAHLKTRCQRQTVMLGFSDSTKDGGYWTANWKIFKTKEILTKVSKEFGITVIFFDGRGGPPARGGGNTHNFYTSLGASIAGSEIQLTVQGQTISSKFGTKISAQFNLEQLLTAGLENRLKAEKHAILTAKDREMLDEMSEVAKDTYQKLKENPVFMSYLNEVSPMPYFSLTNIASRPTARSSGNSGSENAVPIHQSFEDLRAIPFVSSWSQMKQNISGYYGLGSALVHMKKQGYFPSLKQTFKRSLFFRTLIENSMQSMCKTFFPLTAYLANDPKYGDFWEILHAEFMRTKDHVLEISGQEFLLEDNLMTRASIRLRESIVLPLLFIQQYALIRLRQKNMLNRDEEELLKKLVLRSLSGNVNAARNSA